MKCLVLEDRGKKEGDVRAAFSGKGIDVIFCTSSSDFMAAVTASKFDTAVMNAKAWGRGRAIYDYFELGRKLEGKRLVFFNADEQFVPAIKYRKHGEKDMLYREPVEYAALAEAL